MPYRVDDPCWFSGHMVIGQGQTVGLWIKRPLGHITHLRNQFKSINTFGNSFDYIIMLSWRGKKPIISFLIIDISFFVKPWSSCLHQRMLCAKFWLPNDSGEDFLTWVMVFCYFIIIFPWKSSLEFSGELKMLLAQYLLTPLLESCQTW